MRGPDQAIDWCAEAVKSEVAYSVARGGVAAEHGTFIHILNRSVPWGGDYNRAVGVRSADADEFEEIVRTVERIHEEHDLDPPDHFDMWPDVDAPLPFARDLPEGRYRVLFDLFMVKEASPGKLPPGFTWRSVTPDEFVPWWHDRQRRKHYYDPDMCALDLPLERRFAQTFVPFFLERNGEVVAWVHCGDLGGYLKLFGVEVEERERGQGLGRLLLQAVEAEALRRGVPRVLIRCVQRLRPFYRSCGYEECCRGAMVRAAG